jgi:hypothetical protein
MADVSLVSGTRANREAGISKSLERRLKSYAKLSQASNVKVGIGIIGTLPFLLFFVGIAILFVGGILYALFAIRDQNGFETSPFFWALLGGLLLSYGGIVLSVLTLNDVISYVKFASDDDSSPFVFRTPSQEAEYQSKARSDQVAPAYASQFFRGSRDRYGSSGFGSSDDGTYDPAIQTMLARRRQQYGQPFGQQLVPQAFGQPNEEVQALKAKVETVSRAVEQLASQERDTAAVAETALVAASSRGRAAGGKRRT